MSNLNAVTKSYPLSSSTQLLDNTPAGTTALFSVHGCIRLIEFVGYIDETPMDDVETRVKLVGQCDALDAADLCAEKDVKGWNVGVTMHITGKPADTLDEHESGIGTDGTKPVLFTPCKAAVISLVNADGANAGRTRWMITYEPMTPNARVTPLI